MNRKNVRITALCLLLLATVAATGSAWGAREGKVYAVPTSASAEPERILPGARVGPIAVSLTKEQVIKTLGNPDAIYYGDTRYSVRDNPYLAYYVFSKAGLSILFQWHSIVAIGVLSERYEYGKGVRVGMNGTTVQGILGPYETGEIKQSDGSVDRTYATHGTGGAAYRLEGYREDAGQLFLKVNSLLNRVSQIVVFGSGGDQWPPGEFWTDEPLSASEGAKVRASLTRGMGSSTPPLDRYAVTTDEQRILRVADDYPLGPARIARTFSMKETTGAEILVRGDKFDKAFASFGTGWPTAAGLISTVGLPHTFVVDYLGQADTTISVMYYGDSTLIFGTDGKLSTVFLGPKSTYKTDAGIGNGSTREAVFAAYGAPLKTLKAFPLDWDTDRVLYLYGDRGDVGYIRYKQSGYQFYFIGDAVTGFSREWQPAR